MYILGQIINSQDVLCDETLVNFIKQSTWPSAKGRTNKEILQSHDSVVGVGSILVQVLCKGNADLEEVKLCCSKVWQ